MALERGTKLGPFEVVAKLGQGGMGEVYRARDTKLNRDVALKVIPEAFAGDSDRLSRFTREAQVLASLNHPNIAAIYGMESASGIHALVMELVDGDDLSAVIARGPMPLADAMPIARQIADALEAAHEQGIIHRDLKPGNIKVRADGTVKVLDFGLAKALGAPGSEEPGQGSGAAANSPTLTARATQMGMILGTAAYMSPEQARGKPVDRRADIWAFGVVLYEMLTGNRAFEGDDISITLANVLKDDPKWHALPADLPAPMSRLLRRCLEKEPKKRLSSIGDARLELDEREQATTSVASSPVATTRQPQLLARLWPALAGIVATAVVAYAMWPSATPEASASGHLTRLSILGPPGSALYPDSSSVAISPDGTMVAFVVGSVAQANNELWVRSLDSATPRRLEDTKGAVLPFWSPDGTRIGFMTNRKLKTIAITGGRAEVLADTPGPRGAVWTPNDIIIYSPDAGGPLFSISASGGTPKQVTKIDPALKEYGHRFPALLPDGEHFLYAALPGKSGKFDIYAGSLKDDSRVLIGPMDGAPMYAEPGWLLYSRQGALVAVRFDARTLKTTGDPVRMEDEPSSILDPTISFTAGRTVSVSPSGALAYYSAPSLNTVATWHDTSGLATGSVNLPDGYYGTVTISPDGTRAVLSKSISPSESTLWLVDLARGGGSPLSTGPGRNDTPVWSPDGKRIVFASDRTGVSDFYTKTVDDNAPEQVFHQSDVVFKSPTAWSKNGTLAFIQLDAGTAQNLWMLDPANSKTTRYAGGPRREYGGPLSPDEKWMAYASEDTGRLEVYVQSFPTPGRQVQVSEEGGLFAWWSRDGRQMTFLAPDFRTLYRADVIPGPVFRTTTPKKLATLPVATLWVDAHPDLSKFLVITPERIGTGSVTVVQNWKKALQK